MKKIALGIVIGLLVVFNSSAQILTPIENAEEQAQTQEEEQLIIGTWVGEGNTYNYRDVYHSNKTMTDYTEGGNTETYYWAIYTATTESGLKSSTLIVRNTQDPTDEWRYKIDVINNERMILVYNNGIGLQRNLYFRQ